MEVVEACGKEFPDGVVAYMDPPTKKPFMMLLKRRIYLLDWTMNDVRKNKVTSEDISIYNMISEGIFLRLTLESGKLSSRWALVITSDYGNSEVFNLGIFDWSVINNQSIDTSIFNPLNWNGTVGNVSCDKRKGMLTIRDNHITFSEEEDGSVMHTTRGSFKRDEVQDLFMLCFAYRTHLFHDKIQWVFNEFLAMILTETACCRIKQAKKHADNSIRDCASSTTVGFHDQNEIEIISNRYKHDYVSYLENLVTNRGTAFEETQSRARLVFTMFFRHNDFEMQSNFEDYLKAYDSTTVLCFCQLVYRPDHRVNFSPMVEVTHSAIIDSLYQLAKNNMTSVFCMCGYFSANRRSGDDMSVILE